jgi:hypothetical protein
LGKIDDTIFRIKAVLRAIEGEEGLHEFDTTSREILVFIGQAFAAGQNLRATDIASNPAFGSPATIYGRLGKLADSGWIKSIPDAQDGRVKLVVPTSQAQGAFNRMSSALSKLI